MNKTTESLLEALTEVVRTIEGQVETTKGHYGSYMALLSKVDRVNREGLAVALVKCGANKEGVISALRLC